MRVEILGSGGELADGDEVELDGTRVRPFRLAEEYVYAFLLDDGNRRVLMRWTS